MCTFCRSRLREQFGPEAGVEGSLAAGLAKLGAQLLGQSTATGDTTVRAEQTLRWQEAQCRAGGELAWR